MKLDTVLARMTGWYEERISIYLTSAPGVGKTDTISRAPEVVGRALKKNLGLVVINGPLLTPGDAIGYLMPRPMDDGRMESQYSEPFWFKTRENVRLAEYEGGFIFVDEADKTDVDVKKVIGEAALSGRLGPHQLAGGWVVWMAGNTAEHRSGSTKELDHLINRRMEIPIQVDLGSWVNWANANGVSPLLRAWAEKNPQIMFSEKIPDKQGPWCTPRSAVRFDRYLMRLAGGDLNNIPEDGDVLEEAGGMIGAPAAASLFAFVKLQNEMPRYEAIIAAPSKAKLPQKPDAQMLVCYTLAHRVEKEEIDPVIEYIQRLPKEFAVTFAKAACKRNAHILGTPGMQKWAMNNASLMAAIS